MGARDGVEVDYILFYIECFWNEAFRLTSLYALQEYNLYTYQRFLTAKQSLSFSRWEGMMKAIMKPKEKERPKLYE